MPPITRDLLRDRLNWFNRNLPVPDLDSSDWRCLFWFRCDAKEAIGRIWELAWLLADEGVFVRKLRTDSPGMIVYRDRHQVAAVPRRRSVRR